MTPPYDTTRSPDDRSGSKLEEIGTRLQDIQRKVVEIRSRLDDQYNLLREVLESTGKDNGVGWYDPDDGDDGL